MSETKFSDGSGEADIVYRPFNALVLIAFMTMLATVGASLLFVLSERELKTFSGIVVLIGSAITICLGIATYKIDPGGKRLSGSKAFFGIIFFVVLFGSFALAHYQFHMSYLKRTAIAHSETLLKEVWAGNHGKVFSYTVDPRMRIPENIDPEEYYNQKETLYGGRDSTPPMVELQIWLGLEPFATMTKDNFEGTNELIGVGHTERDLYAHYIGVDYLYTPVSKDLIPVHYRFIMERRNYSEPLNVQWQACQVELIAGPEQKRGLQIVGGGTGAPTPPDNQDGGDDGQDNSDNSPDEQ